MNRIVNIAAYKFVALPELRSLRARLLALCKSWELKGTILLSTEGINLFVAGTAEKTQLLLAELRSLPGLEDLTPKISETDHQPFARMLVRLKKEIIAFGVEGIDPAQAHLAQTLGEGIETMARRRPSGHACSIRATTTKSNWAPSKTRCPSALTISAIFPRPSANCRRN